MSLTDFIGFAGVAILLIAYFLNVTDYLPKDHIAYILMNLLGAGIACLASVLLNYWPFIILEASWVLVSAIALAKHFRK